jgi:hypothetical protein
LSYGIIRIEKYKKGSVKGLQIHDQRQKDVSHTNKDIDFSKSHLNYDLHNAEPINFTEKVSERIKALNLKKAVRHDAVVMCQCLITSGHEFFDGMPKEKQDKFFKDAFDFICHRYGRQNIISATVHFDERTPHMHVNFVPVTSDGRLCAKDLFKKKDLSLLHDDFYRFNKARGYDLERGESKEGFQEHLTTEEFKLKKQEQFLKEEQAELKQGEAELKKKQRAVNEALKASDSVLKQLGYFNTIQTKKTLIGGKITLSEGDYEKLQAFAQQGTMFHELKLNFDKLDKEHKELKKKAETSISERMQHAKEISGLNNKYNDLVHQYNSLWNDREEILEFVKGNRLVKSLNQFQNEKREQEIEQKNSHDWGMEM